MVASGHLLAVEHLKWALEDWETEYLIGSFILFILLKNDYFKCEESRVTVSSALGRPAAP